MFDDGGGEGGNSDDRVKCATEKVSQESGASFAFPERELDTSHEEAVFERTRHRGDISSFGSSSYKAGGDERCGGFIDVRPIPTIGLQTVQSDEEVPRPNQQSVRGRTQRAQSCTIPLQADSGTITTISTTLSTAVRIEHCTKVMGKQPIGVRWVDAIKQDEVIPTYRPRLV